MRGRAQLLNLVAAIAFTIGGSLFALGAALAEMGSADPTAPACVYFAGGLFFNTGGYVSVLQVINSPDARVGAGGLGSPSALRGSAPRCCSPARSCSE